MDCSSPTVAGISYWPRPTEPSFPCSSPSNHRPLLLLLLLLPHPPTLCTHLKHHFPASLQHYAAALVPKSRVQTDGICANACRLRSGPAIALLEHSIRANTSTSNASSARVTLQAGCYDNDIVYPAFAMAVANLTTFEPLELRSASQYGTSSGPASCGSHMMDLSLAQPAARRPPGRYKIA